MRPPRNALLLLATVLIALLSAPFAPVADPTHGKAPPGNWERPTGARH